MRRCAGSRRDDLTRADCPVVVGVMTAADVSHNRYGAGGRGFPDRRKSKTFLSGPSKGRQSHPKLFILSRPIRCFRTPKGYSEPGEWGMGVLESSCWQRGLPPSPPPSGSLPRPAPGCILIDFIRSFAEPPGGCTGREMDGVPRLPPYSIRGLKARLEARNDERGITLRCDCPGRKGDSGAGLLRGVG